MSTHKHINKICAVAIVAAILIYVQGELKGGFSAFTSAAAGVIILYFACGKISEITEYIKILELNFGVRKYISVMLKAFGCSLIAAVVSDICRDCGKSISRRSRSWKL